METGRHREEQIETDEGTNTETQRRIDIQGQRLYITYVDHSTSMSLHICICIHLADIYIYIYIHIYVERDRYQYVKLHTHHA